MSRQPYPKRRVKAAVAAASPTCELLSVSGPEAITASTETFTAHIVSRARVATTSPSLRKPRARLPHSVNVPKRTFTPFGLLRLQNPQQRPPNGASSNEQPSEPARIVDVERQKYLTPNTLERAQAIAGHESPRTTQLYDRTAADIERIKM